MDKNEYNNINTPEELFDFMNNNIKYGFLGSDNKVYFDDSDWLDKFVLQSIDDILSTKVGNCFDQVELERDWFNKHNYKFNIYFQRIEVDYTNPYPMHTFLVYENNNKYYWFENAWSDNKGIHEFDNLEDLFKDVYDKSINLYKNYNISDEEMEKYSLYILEKPIYHSSALEYIEFCSKMTKIN